ncbi:MAG TPA: hypothetical protein VD908_16955 [Cytophagales bacterium]|nr:hypothetical protein [Cytophagales bacterium]
MLKKLFYGFGFEAEGEFYKKFGVHKFKKIVPFGDYWLSLYNYFFSQQLRLISNQRSAEVWVIFTLSVEILHLLGLIIMLYFMVDSLEQNDYSGFIKTTLINVLINLYPLFVQRYNRLRILKIFKLTLQDLQNVKIVI